MALRVITRFGHIVEEIVDGVRLRGFHIPFGLTEGVCDQLVLHSDVIFLLSHRNPIAPYLNLGRCDKPMIVERGAGVNPSVFQRIEIIEDESAAGKDGGFQVLHDRQSVLSPQDGRGRLAGCGTWKTELRSSGDTKP